MRISGKSRGESRFVQKVRRIPRGREKPNTRNIGHLASICDDGSQPGTTDFALQVFGSPNEYPTYNLPVNERMCLTRWALLNQRMAERKNVRSGYGVRADFQRWRRGENCREWLLTQTLISRVRTLGMARKLLILLWLRRYREVRTCSPEKARCSQMSTDDRFFRVFGVK